ncbi:PEP/pyruvate-binding domain-containing protein [Calditrichota bacterium]
MSFRLTVWHKRAKTEVGYRRYPAYTVGNMTDNNKQSRIPRFNREFFTADEQFTVIGRGEIGGKAQGLAFIKSKLEAGIDIEQYSRMTVSIPTMTVITTSVFDTFLEMNNLHELAYSNEPDDRIAHAFQKAQFPSVYVGDIRALISKVKTPLAIRSSSLLEDAMFQPFAGVYETKMIPNNQPDTDSRFRKLVEAIKFVWASTFFRNAKDYIRSTKEDIRKEKMAVIIQEVVGKTHGERYYPEVSGVGRSYNFYPMGRAKPEQGVVDLALGLGKTIVDGGTCWTYSPAMPRANPPFATTTELMKNTQLSFWSVNMGKPPAYDPIHEAEFLIQREISAAEKDATLRYTASTYDGASDRVSPGVGMPGPRILNFSPILQLNEIPLNRLIQDVLRVCEEAVGTEVEIEFAMTIHKTKEGLKSRFGFLQVRPMVVSDEKVEITPDEMSGKNVLAASKASMGNGTVNDIRNVVYLRPELYDPINNPLIAMEIDEINRVLVRKDTPYLLIGFGRWGSSEPWLGVPVTWSQVSGAKAIVEATLPTMNVELSQGSHFFHNLSSFGVLYMSVRHDLSEYKIDWEWLNKQKIVSETEHIRHVEVDQVLSVRVDGRSSRGMILHG